MGIRHKDFEFDFPFQVQITAGKQAGFYVSVYFNKDIQRGGNMDGRIIGFIVWALFGCFMIGLGISAFFSKKAVGFWANIKIFSVNDIRGYNRAECRYSLAKIRHISYYLF